MQFYRVASWLYVVIASLAVPLMVLDMTIDWPGLTAAWIALFGLSVPLMVIQALGLRRVLRERAAEEEVSGLVTWFWFLHFIGAAVVALAAAFYFADKGVWAIWTLALAALPLLGLGVGVGVVKLVLGIRLGKYPDDLFGLRSPLNIAFIAFGALELANMVVVISLPFYLVVAMALVYLTAFVIEGHARTVAPRFGVAPVWISYVLGALVTLGAPLAALPVLIDSFSEQLETMQSSDDEIDTEHEAEEADGDQDQPAQD